MDSSILNRNSLGQLGRGVGVLLVSSSLLVGLPPLQAVAQTTLLPVPPVLPPVQGSSLTQLPMASPTAAAPAEASQAATSPAVGTRTEAAEAAVPASQLAIGGDTLLPDPLAKNAGTRVEIPVIGPGTTSRLPNLGGVDMPSLVSPLTIQIPYLIEFGQPLPDI